MILTNISFQCSIRFLRVILDFARQCDFFLKFHDIFSSVVPTIAPTTFYTNAPGTHDVETLVPLPGCCCLYWWRKSYVTANRLLRNTLTIVSRIFTLVMDSNAISHMSMTIAFSIRSVGQLYRKTFNIQKFLQEPHFQFKKNDLELTFHRSFVGNSETC